MNKLVKAKNNLSEFKRKHGTVDAYKKTFNDNLKAAREQYVSFINEQFAEPAEDFVKAAAEGELETAPRVDTDWLKLDEAADEKYLNTGRF